MLAPRQPQTQVKQNPNQRNLSPVTFAGENSDIANLDTLKTAKERYTEEASKETPDFKSVWRETGWFKGLDGSWRFEIDDSEASWKDGQLVHPKLQEAYPNLFSEYTVVEEDMSDEPGLLGYHDAKNKKIAINKERSEEEKLSTAVHEFQHAVQSAEGFAEGGNSHMSSEFVRDEKLRGDTTYIDLQKQQEESRSRLDTLRELGSPPIEFEFSEKALNDVRQYVDKLNSIAPEELQIDLDALIEANPPWSYEASQGATVSLSDLRKDISKAHRKLYDTVYEQVLETRKQAVDYRMGVKVSLDEAFDGYQRLAGEEEARLTQDRLGLSEEERQGVYPLLGFDHPAFKQIFHRGGKTFNPFSQAEEQSEE